MNNIRPYLNTAPQIAPGGYIDPMAVVIGDVVLGENVSVWPFAVIRGDVTTSTSATTAMCKTTVCCM